MRTQLVASFPLIGMCSLLLAASADAGIINRDKLNQVVRQRLQAISDGVDKDGRVAANNMTTKRYDANSDGWIDRKEAIAVNNAIDALPKPAALTQTASTKAKKPSYY